jgi:hypothetical protein
MDGTHHRLEISDCFLLSAVNAAPGFSLRGSDSELVIQTGVSSDFLCFLSVWIG